MQLLLGIYYYPKGCLAVVSKRKVLREGWVLVDGVPTHINAIEGSGCYEKMFRRFKGQVDLMLEHDRKVLAVPLTVNFMTKASDNCERYPECLELINAGNNRLMSDMIRAFRVYLRSAYGRELRQEQLANGGKPGRRLIKITRLGFFWVREFSKDGEYPHYHLWLLVDGSQIQSAYWLSKKLRLIASKFNFALFYFKGTQWRLDRKDPSSYWSLLYHLSYATKEASKDSSRKCKNANEYDSSKLRPPNPLKKSGSVPWTGFQLQSIERHFRAGNVFTINRHRDRLTYRSFNELEGDIAHLNL